MKILTAEQMRQIDRECTRQGTPESRLMENAGRAVAGVVREALGNAEEQHVLCLVGPGNNGGDGLVAARYLHDWGFGVSVYLCARRPPDDANLKLVRESGITCVEADKDKDLKKYEGLLASASCVIDALLGTGRLRPLEGVFGEVLKRAGEARKERRIYVVAVDVPSGLDADSGAIDLACIPADLTVTMAFPKLGLYSFPGAGMVGRLRIADIGIPETLADSVTTELITDEWARDSLPARPSDANKGSFGRVLVAAGSVNYIGAAYLACTGAMRVGAGLVTLATPASLQPVLAAKLTEATYLPLPESVPGSLSPEAPKVLAGSAADYRVRLLGCGLGQSPPAAEFIRNVVFGKDGPPLVLDADALNVLAGVPDWWQRLSDDAILTPHPGEMARLCRLSVAEVQAARVGVASRFAAEWRKTLVLKGAHTVVAAPDGRCRISPYANPGLASAGTGDVLAGAIAGLVAQGLALFDAASLGVYLHGEAAERLRKIMGDTGMLASDLLPALPLVIKQLRE